jgi:hypothetical protein
MMHAHSVVDLTQFVVCATVKRSSLDLDVRRRSAQTATVCCILVKVATLAMVVVLVTSKLANVDVDILSVVLPVNLKPVQMIAWTAATATRTMGIAHVVMMKLDPLSLDLPVNSEPAPLTVLVVASAIAITESVSARMAFQGYSARKPLAVRMTTYTMTT